MKIEDYRKFEYGCQDTQGLLVLYILYPEELTVDERSEVDKHLDRCLACREDYRGMKHIFGVLGANREQLIFKKHPEIPFQQKLTHEEIMERRFQNKLRRAGIRRKRRERKERFESFKRLLRPISAIAACLVIGFGVFFTISQCRENVNNHSFVVSNQQHNQVKIELISATGNEIIPAGQVIAAVDGLKALKINNNRQMVLNVGTKLSIEPYNLGCRVKLEKGEICAQVEHDGKPFIIETRHGRAVITGTTFNIKSDDKKMELAVVEGAVQFESEKGAVNVQGGYQSSVALGFGPLEPTACDVVEVATWANLNKTIQISKSRIISEMPELITTSVPYRNLEDIDYNNWIIENRVWFEREFPWTKTLQSFLQKDGIAVDSLELLISSGALIQFGYPEQSRTQLLYGSPVFAAKAALKFGYDEKFLNTKGYLDSLSEPIGQTLGVKAFEQWLNAIKKADANTELNSTLLLSSIHAAVFLVNTRSLVWFAVKRGEIPVLDKLHVLDLLTEEIKTVSNSLETINQLLLVDKESACSVIQYEKFIREFKCDITSIRELEEKIKGYKFVRR